VLSDLVMPGSLSGLELAQWLERERPALPILLYSGYSREMAQARELGFTVLQKPVVPEALLAELQRQLHRHGGSGAPPG
jgi:CheY-like chemotaxis protein